MVASLSVRCHRRQHALKQLFQCIPVLRFELRQSPVEHFAPRGENGGYAGAPGFGCAQPSLTPVSVTDLTRDQSFAYETVNQACSPRC